MIKEFRDSILRGNVVDLLTEIRDELRRDA